MASSPIADLSYRDYDGPLSPPQYRWWVIARQTMRLAFKKKGLWLLTTLSGFYYLIMLIVLFFVDQNAASSNDAETMLRAFMSRIEWKSEFATGWSSGQMWLMFIALLVGAGAIANDNRANALLVYLSKPCDKKDYLFGKWMGVFLTLLLASAIPTLAFYAYAGLSYAEYGFFSQDKLLLPKLFVKMAVGSAFYASLVIGISSLFKQGRIAGATLAATYFLTYFFTKMMDFAHQMASMDEGAKRDIGPVIGLIRNLYYASIDGLQIGMAKGVLGTDGTLPFGIRPTMGQTPHPVPAPSFWVTFFVMASISSLAMWIAWRRIRPVEVVG